MYAKSHMDAKIQREAMAKRSKALASQSDGKGCSGRTWHRDEAGLPAVIGQRDLRPVPAEAPGGECADRGLAVAADDGQSDPGLRVVLSVPAQYEAL